MRERVNSGLVGLISEGMDGSGLAEATELAAGLDGSRDNLRILPIAGKGALQNVTDIVFARGIDIGIIQSDVLAALKRNPPFPHVESFLQYITRLYLGSITRSFTFWPRKALIPQRTWRPRK